jgi:hypothetical protein
MKINRKIPPVVAARVKSLAPAIGAFALVAVGTLVALPDGKSSEASARIPTVVAVGEIAAGTTTDEMRGRIEILNLEPEARAAGALTSVADIPDGVLTGDLVDGQQVLASGFSATQVAALGDDYAAVSVRLDPQQWVGPVIITGDVVDVYDVFNEETTLVASGAVILDAPDPESLDPNEETIISLGVRRESLPALLVAATNNRVWLTGA